ncbi:HIT-like domain-containing protein [Powellomyces hirtus]|nr:HIT-like domain-containing protein [Powellomyces hirtus]
MLVISSSPIWINGNDIVAGEVGLNEATTIPHICRSATSHFIHSLSIMASTCLFCKIVKGAIPSFKVLETELSLAFLDVGPLSKGHLVISKAKKVAKALNVANYNILQNNGRLAHQEVDHVHFHIIPKPNDTEGLGVGWPAKKADMDELKKLSEEIQARI